VVHADRGTSMTSKTVAALLSDLEVTRSHSRPRVFRQLQVGRFSAKNQATSARFQAV
jgi:transposase InsO family protein